MVSLSSESTENNSLNWRSVNRHVTDFSDLCCRFFFSSRRRHTRSLRDWSSDVCSSDLLLSPKDWARLEDEADARGLTLVGYYHSHPDSPAIASVYDRDHALPRFVYIITQVQDRKSVV